MQSKISAFFKPTTPDTPLGSSLVFDSIEETPLFDTVEPPEIRITYSRRIPKTNLSSIDQEHHESSGEKRNSSASGSTFVKPSSKVLNKKRTFAQLYLELGKTDFLLHNCSICGLKYARGDDGDEKVHKEFHKNYTLGIPFKGWRNERVVPNPNPLNSSDTNSRVVLVLDSDPHAQKNKVKEVAMMMERELGLSDGWLLHKLCKVYLFISANRIAGCLVAEPIRNGYKVISTSGVHKSSQRDNTKPDKSISTVLQFGNVNFQREVVKRVNKKELLEDQSGAIFCEEEAMPASCGVRAIWVAPSSRKKHVATRLLDAVRTSFCAGYILEHSQLAFSQPTSSGKALASSYSGTESFLVYNTGLNC